MREEKLLQLIEKIANEYEYEEVQTIVEETKQGTKKRVVRTRKYQPANLQAAQYLLSRNRKKIDIEQTEKLINESIKKIEADDNWNLKL